MVESVSDQLLWPCNVDQKVRLCSRVPKYEYVIRMFRDLMFVGAEHVLFQRRQLLDGQFILAQP